ALSSTATLAQVPEIVPSDGSRTIQQLEIGNDLYVTLEGVQPNRDYRLMLVDEAHAKVVEEVRQSDAAGRVSPGEIPLWQRTGIVGCDLESPADPSSFLYRDLGQADAMLGGRGWTIEARELGTDQLVTSFPLTLTTHRTRAIFFFTDATGCPRNQITDRDSLFLYAEGVRPDVRDAQVVLIGGGFPPSVGDPLTDARSTGPQGIDLEPGQGTFFELLWSKPAVGRYGGVVRWNRDTDLFFRGDDRWVGRYNSATDADADNSSLVSSQGVSPHGITVVPWDHEDDPDLKD
ncbi:MAG: hypothetical protein AAFY88_06270, partial [Acidobacteriota bacterium]